MARQTPLTCSGHTRPVVHLSFSDITPYGYFLISACKDGKPMLRQGDTGDWLGTFEGHKGAVWGATLNRNATQAATGAADFTVKVWDALSGDELMSFAHKHIVKSVDFSEDGHQLLTGSNEKLLRIFDLHKTDAEPEILKGHTSSIKAALWSDDNKYIFSGGDDKVIRIWEKQSLSEIKTIELGSPVSGMDLTRDGQTMIVTYGKTVSFWDTNTFEKIKSFDLPNAVNSASLHPSKTSFVAGGEDFIIYKYNYDSGKEIESFKGHFGPVHCIRFSPDGELYASGSEDGTLRLWQNDVGKTYGLWKAIEDCNNSINDVTSAEN